MAINQDVLDQMDEAAKIADEDLGNLQATHVKAVADWWKKHYLKSGHKRLAKILLKHAD